MEKYIHYCWFGGKPLPKLAKKCLKSWQKYLPDYQIIEWNENNFDVNMTKFSKGAYEAKKWAFVSDVARIYALKKYGGIYFDTDMLIKKDVHFLEEDEVFAGWESEYNVAVGVLGVKKPNNELINKIWQFYLDNEFSEENVYSLSIPTILTNILKSEYHLGFNHLENQTLEGGIKIYARDYFYPISSDKTPNMFTENTCMVHYYVGSWLTRSEKLRIKFQMAFGKKLGDFLLNVLILIKRIIKKIAKIILYPVVIYRRNHLKQKMYLEEYNDFITNINKLSKPNYLVFYNKNWLGTQNATTEIFENVIGIEELWSDKLISDIAEEIVKRKIKLVVFSAFSFGWDDLVKKLKDLNPHIIIKVIWHGSNAMNVEEYDWICFELIFKLLEAKLIDKIAFVKKSMYEFYKSKGYEVELLLNNVYLNEEDKAKYQKPIKDKFTRIGLYASGDRWVKNFYNQLGAASLIKNGKIDCIPITEKTLKLAKILKTTVSGLTKPVSREKLLERMGKNDLNFYVTFSECAPLIPLESLELGVPCLTSNNHHYFEGTELEKYLIVNENDNMMKIYEQAKLCLENKDLIINLYQKWKKDYDKKAKKSVKKFLEK